MRLFLIAVFVLLNLPLFSEGRYSLSIEQDGQVIPLISNTVTLEKKPFTMVFTLSQPMSVLLNFSTKPKLYNLFK